VLEQIRALLGRGDYGWRLLVPTSTMAEHTRHALAREGFIFDPQLIGTLAGLARELAQPRMLVPEPVLDWLIGEALGELNPSRFRPVAEFEGFRRALARSIRELAAAGVQPALLSEINGAEELAAIYTCIEGKLNARELALDGEIMLRAAARLQQAQTPAKVFLDGFFTFTDPELALIEALSRVAEITITLPAWDGAAACLNRLKSFGFSRQELSRSAPKPELSLLRAPTLEQEVKEIAARIVESGRPFRQVGIIMRSGGNYLSAFRTVLERFGIPARFHFATSLYSSPLVRQILTGGDRGHRARPAEWEMEYRTRAASFLPSVPVEPGAYREVLLWRSRAAALAGFAEALKQATALLDEYPQVSGEQYARCLSSVLRLTPLSVADGRRNVAHVMDAYEARQWRLPVVFVCGLVEREFPMYPAPDPLLTEEIRQSLRRRGLRLRTAADYEAQERFLFELATSRATETLVLSYHSSDPKGNPVLRSFFLDRFLENHPATELEARRLRPAPVGSTPPEPRVYLADEVLKEHVRRLYRRLSTTAIEDFLQCPFKFFAGHTLKLEIPPPASGASLDSRLEGEVAHDVLKRWIFSRGGIGRLVWEALERICRREGIPKNHRFLASGLELQRSLRHFISEARHSGFSPAQAEVGVEVALGGLAVIAGRIDRIDISEEGELIIDYKYSRADNVRKILKEHEQGLHIQGGIYAEALRRRGRRVAGVLFAALRGRSEDKDKLWYGWQENDLNEVIRRALEFAEQAVTAIHQGNIAPKPARAEICEHCDFQDICRVETAAAAEAAGASNDAE